MITCLRARPTLLARRIVTRQAPGLTPKKRRPASDGVDGQIRKPGDQGRSGLTPRMATRDSARQRNRSNNQESSTSLESSGASSGSEAESGSRGGAHARRVGHRAGLRLSARSARGDASPRNSWRSPSRPRIGLASSPLPYTEWVCIETQCIGRNYRGRNPTQPRQILRKIEKIRCIIVPERSIRQLSLRSARLPVDSDVQAFFINTNQLFLHEWVKYSCLYLRIFSVQTP